MSIYSKFRTDPRVEAEGVILDYGSGEKIRVARAGRANKRYLAAMERFHRRYEKQLQHRLLDEDVAQRALIEIYADTIILGWEGIKGPDGEPLPFNRDNAIKLLTDLPDLFQDIRDASINVALFREALDEADGKN